MQYGVLLHLCRTVPRQYTGKSMGEEKGTRYNPEAYLAQKRNNPQKKAAAREEAVEVARFLSEKYGARVYGIGSLFNHNQPFSDKSDIDLVVMGLPKRKFFFACAEAQELTQFTLDIIPYEDANDLIHEIVKERGVAL